MVVQLDWKKSQKVAVGEAQLHTAAGAGSNGEWINVEGIGAWSIDVDGISGDTLKAHGSNKLTAPADADAERQLGSDIVADRVIQFDAPLKWFKVSISNYGSGTINVVFRVRNSK